MGVVAAREAMYSAISTDSLEEIEAALEKHPELLNEPLTEDKKSNALMRAAYLGNLRIVHWLVEKGADPNWTNEEGMDPAKWAAARGHTQVCQFLFQNGYTVTEGLNALDYGVLHGFYPTVHYLATVGLRPTKSVWEYIEMRPQNEAGIRSTLQSLAGGTLPAEHEAMFACAPVPSSVDTTLEVFDLD